jgi:hypothetical protein
MKVAPCDMADVGVVGFMDVFLVIVIECLGTPLLARWPPPG